tara:strand:+ start:175 stop:375 length:201 start_codon:yes stop_codon:yes gene_type:complete
MDELRAYAAKKGFEIEGEYLDQGVSGSRTSRPQLDAMLAKVKDGKINAVIVWKLSIRSILLSCVIE